jgi:hypothetical protein
LLLDNSPPTLDFGPKVHRRIVGVSSFWLLGVLLSLPLLRASPCASREAFRATSNQQLATFPLGKIENHRSGQNRAFLGQKVHFGANFVFAACWYVQNRPLISLKSSYFVAPPACFALKTPSDVGIPPSDVGRPPCFVGMREHIYLPILECKKRITVRTRLHGVWPLQWPPIQEQITQNTPHYRAA